VSDSGDVDVQVVDNTHCASGITTQGALVDYIGDSCSSLGSAGSGVFNSFVRLAASPTESGYNTDGALEFDTKGGAFTHSIKVSDIPVVNIGGQNYWELFADINDSNANDPAAARISLNDVEVYLTNPPAPGGPTLTGYPFGANATKVYDFAGNIKINDVNSGSGRGDLRYDIPLTAGIPVPSNCGYLDPSCSTYFVLYPGSRNGRSSSTRRSSSRRPG
jgi:hypothetical protein